MSDDDELSEFEKRLIQKQLDELFEEAINQIDFTSTFEEVNEFADEDNVDYILDYLYDLLSELEEQELKLKQEQRSHLTLVIDNDANKTIH